MEGKLQIYADKETGHRLVASRKAVKHFSLGWSEAEVNPALKARRNDPFRIARPIEAFSDHRSPFLKPHLR